MNRTSEEQDLATILGTNTRAARLSLGLTQETTARKIGISPHFYGRVERGEALPSVPTLRRTAAILETSIDKLLGLPGPICLG